MYHLLFFFIVDKEELREDQEVTVSRRELSDLVAELLDMNSLPDMNSFCNTIENPIQNVDENQYLTMNENEIISCETQTDEASVSNLIILIIRYNLIE